MNINNSYGKELICENDSYYLPKDTIILSLGEAYENGRADTEVFDFGKLWSAFLSSSITFLITVITFGLTSNLGEKKNLIVFIIFCGLFAATMMLFAYSMWRSKKTTKTVANLRNKTVDEIMNKIHARSKEKD